MLRLIAVSLLVAATAAGGAQAAVGPPPQAWTSDGGGPGSTRSFPGDWLAPPLTRRWARDVGGTFDGRGNANPLVAEDRVFVPSSHDGSNGTDSGGSVIALDRLTGERLWERALPASRLVYDEGTLALVGDQDDLMVGLDPATGRTRWVRWTSGSGAIPVAYGGRMYVEGAAFDIRDGAALGVAFAGRAAFHDGAAYAREWLSCGPLRAYDADTWQERWIAATPQRCMAGVGPQTDGDVVVAEGIVRDAATGAELWSIDRYPMTLAGGAILSADTSAYPGRVVADEARTGVRRWSYVPFGDQRGPTLAVGSTVWDLDSGGLYARDLATGQQVGQVSGAFTSYRTGLVAGQGTLLTRDYESGLIAFSREGPDTRISRRPDAHTSSSAARFEFSTEGEAAAFECSLDGTAWTTCSSPLELTGQGAGDHRLEVRSVVDGERDPAPSVAAWTIDTTAPEPSLENGPTGTSTSRSASFGVRDGDTWALARCSLDGTMPQPCRDTLNLTGLADGEHTLTLTSRDLAGNSGTAQRTWKVDATPPDTTIADGPHGRVATRRATFRMLASESGSGFRCRLDDGAETTCESPVTYDGIADGAHRFEVAAVDAVGNRDASPAVWTWSVAGGEPDPTPTPEPTATATAEPSATPTSSATAEPSATPTAEARATPTAAPGSTATPAPSGDPLPLLEDPGPLSAPRLSVSSRVYASRLRRGRVVVRVKDVPSWMTARARLKAGGRTLAASKRADGRGPKAIRLRLAPRKRMLRHRVRRARVIVTLTAAGESAVLRRSVRIVRWPR